MKNVQPFNTDLSGQREWSWLLAIWLFLGGTGAGLFIFYKAFGLPLAFALVALGVVMCGGGVLLSELGNPQRVWRTVSRPGTSWLSRGVLFVLCFLVTGFLAVAPQIAAFAWLPWDAAGAAAATLGWIAALCALMIVLYPGFFLAANRAIPFWNTPMLPLILIVYAGIGASGVVLALSGLLGASAPRIEVAALSSIIIGAAVLATYLFVMNGAGGPARESVRRLTGSTLGRVMGIGVVAVGMALPAAVILWFSSAPVLAGTAMLIGCLLFRYCVLKAGVFVAPALAAAEYDFSRLNRKSALLEREYAGMAAQHDVGGG